MIPAWLRGGCDCPKINPFVVIFGDRSVAQWARKFKKSPAQKTREIK